MNLKVIFLLIASLISSQFSFAQITEEDTLSCNIREIIEELQKVRLKGKKFEKYFNIKYAFNKYFDDFGASLTDDVNVCSRAFLTDEIGSEQRFSFYEYSDSLKSMKHYQDIEDILINKQLEEVQCFKGYNFFRYKNIICISQYYTDEYSKLIKLFTGNYPLFAMRVNKHIAEKDKKYWNFERNK